MKKHAIKAYKEIELNRAADNPLKNLVKIFELVKKKIRDIAYAKF